MSTILKFHRRIRRRRRRSANCKRKSTPSTKNSQPSSRIVKQTIAAANVFQQLALENRYALEMLERLARTMLAETRRRGDDQAAV